MKPILTITTECKECEDGVMYSEPSYPTYTRCTCGHCKGTGKQTKEIYLLRDFEEILCTGCDKSIKECNDWIIKRANEIERVDDGSIQLLTGGCCPDCDHEYYIPFENYDIKKVSEITEEEAHLIVNTGKYDQGGANFVKLIMDGAAREENTEGRYFRIVLRYTLKREYNLKESDELVLRRI